MKSTTGGQTRFSAIPNVELSRSTFNRSMGLKTTFDAGLLVPILTEEALPGDTMNLRCHTFGRLATPLHPILDNLYLDTHFFAVPMRLIWNNWAKFCGEQDDPGDSTDYTIPQITTDLSGVQEGSIGDYFGIPTNSGTYDVSAMFHRAYNLIWNEWFRDQNLQDSLPCPKGSGPDDPGNYGVRRRGKRHDYFTSALPWPQKGDAVTLPLGTSAPIVTTGDPFLLTQTGVTEEPETDFISSGDYRWGPSSITGLVNGDPMIFGAVTGLEADLTSATAATINTIRTAFQIQKLLERDARGGTRLTEIIRSHFGVTSPDARQMRPEYLGGGSQSIGFSPIPQTSSTDGTSPQGNLSAIGTTTGSNHGFQKSFTEHCIVMGFVSIRADLNYQQGLHRKWSRKTKYDFYWPALAHLGEQSILNKEIYVDGTAADDLTFGYQERWAEYRYNPSQISGAFRSNAATPLDTWHLAQDFESLPVLDAAFIEDTPPIERIIAVPSEPHMLLDCFFEFTHARAMPTYAVPGQIDRF